jgi:glycosyltransferase involved in cell wall biosynthesis
MPVFTVITPVYNGEEFIKDTVDSVLKVLSDFSFEYIVVDDGSTDQTAFILESFGSSIIYMRTENSGQAAAISQGIEIAQGTYSLIVNADDPLFTSDLFADSKRILDEEPGVVATYPNWQIIDIEGNIISSVEVEEFSLEELVGNFNCLIGPGGVFRTQAAKLVGGWDSSYSYVPDYDFWLRMVDFGEFRHVPKTQAFWRQHDTSISIKSRGNSMAKERVRVISEYLSRNPNIPRQLRKRAIANSYFSASMLSFFDRSVRGKYLLVKSLIQKPQFLYEKDFRVIGYILCFPFSFVAKERFRSVSASAEKLIRKIRSS